MEISKIQMDEFKVLEHSEKMKYIIKMEKKNEEA